MNPFFDISDQTEVPDGSLQLYNLGSQRIYMSFGKRVRGDYGERDSYESNHVYTDVTTEDYDEQFIAKLLKVRPSYHIDKLIDHHFQYYLSQHSGGGAQFLKHMRYEIFPKLKQRSNNESYIELFGQWLDAQSDPAPKKDQAQTVNNTINFGDVHAPVQFQQNAPNSTQNQHNTIHKEDIKTFLELLRSDIAHMDEHIRKDFAMEMDYASAQLSRDRDVRPQLSTIGGLMKDVGIGTFTNLLAAPIFEIVKPFLGLH